MKNLRKVSYAAMFILLLLSAKQGYSQEDLNLALNKTVEASGEAIDWGSYKTYVNDGNYETRWQATTEQGVFIETGKYLDESWIYIDLGESIEIDAAILYWEAAFAIGYTIEVSADAAVWDTIFEETVGDGGIDILSFDPVEARYVQLRTSIANMEWFPSVWEFEIFATGTMPATLSPGSMDGEIEEAWDNIPSVKLEKQLVYDNVTDENDFSVNMKITHDIADIYILFEVTDDVIETEIDQAKMVDNVEVYFDMNNSKNALWPRDAGDDETAFESGDDMQLRFMPGKPYDEDANPITNVALGYKATDTGYIMEIGIPIDALKQSFESFVGKKIGFDVLFSDNDTDPNARDQLALFSPSVELWHDPCLWGTIQYADDSLFTLLFDDEAPETPRDLTAEATENTIELTWRSADDNRATDWYTIFDGDETIIEQVRAQEFDNSYTLTELDDGEYSFAISAIDVNGNESAISDIVATEVITESITKNSIHDIRVYPNPVSETLTIRNIDEKSTIELFDYQGRSIRSIKNSVGSIIEIPMNNLIQGMYILKITMENSGSEYQRIVKN